MVLAAVRSGKASGKTPADMLEEIVIGKFSSELSDGKTVISVTEAGGTSSFAIVGGMTPADIVEIAMEALTWLQDQEDPANPPVVPAKRIKRLRVSFAKATI